MEPVLAPPPAAARSCPSAPARKDDRDDETADGSDDLITLGMPPRVSERRAADDCRTSPFQRRPLVLDSFFRLYNSHFLSPYLLISVLNIFSPLTVNCSCTKDNILSQNFMSNSITFVYFRPKKKAQMEPRTFLL